MRACSTVAAATPGRNTAAIVCGDRLVLQLHDFEVEHHHGRIGDPDASRLATAC